MPRQLHSAPAAAAITFVLCTAGFAFIVFVLVAAASFQLHRPLTVPGVGAHILNLTRATGMVLLLGYLSGMIVWILLFVLRRDGMHRLAELKSRRQAAL